jgi:hypothetical protein
MLAMLAGCVTDNPTASVPGGSASPSRSDPGPSASIRPVASPEQTDPSMPEWTFTRIPFAGWPNDAAGGPAGLVAVGECPASRRAPSVGCDPDAPGHYYASALGSPDGRIWEQASVEGSREAGMWTVEWNGSYVATGRRCIPAPNPRGCHYETGVWRSEDGLDWRLISSLSFGSGHSDRHTTRSIAMSPSGALVLGWVLRSHDPGVSGIDVSRDGTTWSRVSSEAFGPDWHFGQRYDPYDVIGTDSGFALVGTGCDLCRTRSYLSEDGETWRLAGELPINPTFLFIDLASNGRQVVALVLLEGNGGDWAEVWWSPDGGTWTRQLAMQGIPTLGYAGGAFVIVGDITYGDQRDYVAWVSADGESWTKTRPVFLASATSEPERACTEFIGGGPDGVLIGGECGVWRADPP